MDILPDLHATRVLIVENDFKAADRAVTILRESGYIVQNAYNPGDALAADHTHFDLAVVNPAMRDRDGIPILERIKHHETFQSLPILIVSDEAVSGNAIVLRRA